jgi:nicotinamide riboside kinase
MSPLVYKEPDCPLVEATHNLSIHYSYSIIKNFRKEYRIVTEEDWYERYRLCVNLFYDYISIDMHY